ncbi:hypothetical protein ABEF95_007211 [Exophiala dermatitidis]
MASSQSSISPVLTRHASPPHARNPEVTVVALSAFSSEPRTQLSAVTETSTVHATASSPSEPERGLATTTPELLDTEMTDAPHNSPDALLQLERDTRPGDGFPQEGIPPNEESHESQESVSEVEGPTPSRHHDTVSLDIPERVSGESQVDGQATEQTDEQASRAGDMGGNPSPPPPDAIHGRRRDVPIWVTWEDDLSAITEEELNELESTWSEESEPTATDVPRMEKYIYRDVDDPEQRPVKKLRLSWIIKRVRGTRDKPKYARMMVSPAAKVDENYWQIKFYPRGNKSSSVSAYISCNRHPPKVDANTHIPECTFSVFEGAPNVDLGTAAPSQSLKIESHTRSQSISASVQSVTSSALEKSHHDGVTNANSPNPQTPDDPEPQPGESTDLGGKEGEQQDWRVSAQLGMVIYNPEEPRTCEWKSSQHQFAKTNDDWGWTSLVDHWDDIHIRQHLQRQPLLRNDTIAIDAYIRIFDDPTQALWWHPSDAEPAWNSKSLAGYYPMGSDEQSSSPALAGLSAWLLLAPFRKVLQSWPFAEYERHSREPLKPIVSELQSILSRMRSLDSKTAYVSVDGLVRALKNDLGESYIDVKTFWEVLRRAIELEFRYEPGLLIQLSSIFDSPDNPNSPMSLPPLPVQGVKDIQQGLDQVLDGLGYKGRLPNFLPLFLARQRFDEAAREWKTLNDRVVLNEVLDVSKYCGTGKQATYTLYGFVVHKGQRTSENFFSVLRPGGPNTKWLAFDDECVKRIHSYTRKRIEEYQGFTAQTLPEGTRSSLAPSTPVAYLAMYVKTDVLQEYLPGVLEPYQPSNNKSSSMAHEIGSPSGLPVAPPPDSAEMIKVAYWSDETVIGQKGLLDVHSFTRRSEQSEPYYTTRLPKSASFAALRHKVAEYLRLENPDKVLLFRIGDEPSNNRREKLLPLQSDHATRPCTTICPLLLWVAMINSDEELDLLTEYYQALEGHLDRDRSSGAAVLGRPQHLESGDGIELAGPDAEQASLHAAVAADIERIGTMMPAPEPAAAGDPDTQMSETDVSPPTAEESLTAEVPHGHLVEAQEHEGQVAVLSANNVEDPFHPPADEDVTGSPQDGERAGMGAVSTDRGEPEEIFLDPGLAEMEEDDDTSSSESLETETEAQVAAPKGLSVIFGFLQTFDMDEQTFTVRSSFFARRSDNVKDVVRRRMGWPADKDFHVWRREDTVRGSAVESNATFESDDLFWDGIYVIVREQLSEARCQELCKQGKYLDPFELSAHLQMVARNHPVLSKTTAEAEPVEICEFGGDYYKGPLVMGRRHGEHCVHISSAGEVYEGPLVCNVRCGKGGKMTYPNGDVYIGEWADGMPHGQGTFVQHRTGNKYVGGFEYGKRWGMGTTYWQVADEQADLCQICYGNDIDALFFSCGHVCACVDCAKQCEICPICRKPVAQVVKMFRA